MWYIRAFTDAGFEVNLSKVTTLYGGNITVYTNKGDIDAGRGSKSALALPETLISTDVDGNTKVEFKGSSAGSGIRARTYDADGVGPLLAPAKGNVSLFAPRGVLDAGEAGIEAGNFIGGAQQILNAQEITVSGSSSGIAVSDTSSIAGSLAGASNTASGATESATAAVSQATQANTAAPKVATPSVVTVRTLRLEE